MTKEKPTEPRLRFPGFTDAWKQRKLGEVADFSVKTNSFSRDKLSSYFYEVQNIHYGDILTKYDAILNVSNEELPSIIESKVSNFEDALLVEGDIVFADAAEDSTVGKAIEVRNFNGKNVVSGLHTIVARPKISYAPYYLGYLINSNVYHNQILPLMQGTKVSSISKANLKLTTVAFPTLPEQEAIGSFFSDLDQLITLHQRKLDDVKELKKALLQKMFPKGNGNDFPELRFPEFTDAWKQRKLGEVVEINPKSVLPDKFKYVDLESVVGTEMISHRTEYKNSAPSRAQRVASKGDIFYQTVRPYQKNNYLFNLDSNDYVFSTGYAQLRPSCNGYFVFTVMQTEKFVNKVLDNCTGTSYPAINANKLAEISIFLPPTVTSLTVGAFPEQEAIGSFFSDLDQLITLHQRQLDHLKLLKKALLQQMFI